MYVAVCHPEPPIQLSIHVYIFIRLASLGGGPQAIHVVMVSVYKGVHTVQGKSSCNCMYVAVCNPDPPIQLSTIDTCT